MSEWVSETTLNTKRSGVLKENSGGKTRAVDVSNGREYVVTDDLWEVLSCFGVPRSIGAARSAPQKRMGASRGDRLENLISGLLHRGLLEYYDGANTAAGSQALSAGGGLGGEQRERQGVRTGQPRAALTWLMSSLGR